MWSVFLQEKRASAAFLLSHFITMRGFQRWGRTSTVTFEGSVREEN